MYLRAILMAAFIVLVVSSPALAQSADTLEGLIVELYSGAVRIVGLAAFLMILFAGMVRMGIIPGRSPAESNDIIKDAIIGTVLLLSSVVILRSINEDLVTQERPVFEETRFDNLQPPRPVNPSGTGGSSASPSVPTRTSPTFDTGPRVITPNDQIPPATFIRGAILPIFVQ